MTLADTLQLIRQLLEQNRDPFVVIAELSPQSLPDAIHWARMRPLWDEYRGQFPDQVIGIAAVVSRRAMENYRLEFGEDGRVRERHSQGKARKMPEATSFPLVVLGQELCVEYTQERYPTGEKVYFYFTSTEPGTPNPLTWTGYLSQYAHRDEVEACGGPEAFAARFAEVRLAEKVKEPPVESFNIKRLEVNHRHGWPVEQLAVEAADQPPSPEKPAPGVAEETKEKQPSRAKD